MIVGVATTGLPCDAELLDSAQQEQNQDDN
jgi:hypothetical protein